MHRSTITPEPPDRTAATAHFHGPEKFFSKTETEARISLR
jgi:hypothetical protein